MMPEISNGVTEISDVISMGYEKIALDIRVVSVTQSSGGKCHKDP
jgi:hypothetical protein